MPRSTPEALALRWVPGSGPVDLHPLARGLVNESFRVQRAGRRYVMRVIADAAPDLGQDRRWECQVLAAASAAGLAPLIERCEVDEGVLVAAWVDCRAWSPAEAAATANLQAMAELLHRVHELPVPRPGRVMDPAAWARYYAAALARYGSADTRWSGRFHAAAARKLAQSAAVAPRTGVLCHSDLHRLNVAVGLDSPESGLLLLDWEYAHVADPYWDLAGWAANNDWGQGMATAWLESYLGRSARLEEAQRLLVWMWLYDYVCLLWSELYLKRAPEEAVPGVKERLETLIARLSSESGSRVEQVPAH